VIRLDTALGRPIRWSYPSNRFAVIGSAAGTVILAVIRLMQDRPVTIGNLVGTCAALFLAWAVAREIDPDEHPSAATALVLAALAILQFGFASVWLVVGVLLGLRSIVGTVGVSLRAGDVVVLSALAAFIGVRYASWIVIAVLVAGAFSCGGRRRAGVGFLVAAAGLAGIAFSRASAGFVMPGLETVMVLVGVVASAVILSGGPEPTSVTDRRQTPIGSPRLVVGRLAAALAVLVVGFQTGLAAALGPVAAALLASAGVRLVRMVQPEVR
jgi:hypothetical protein